MSNTHKIKNAIKDGMHIAIVFSFDKYMKIRRGDKIDLSVVDFHGEIELKEIADSYTIIREKVVNGKHINIDNYVIFKSKSYSSCVDYPELQRILRTLKNLTDYAYDIDNFDIYLYNNNYPVVFIENAEKSHRDYCSDYYGFVIAPLKVGDEEVVCGGD